MGTGIYIHIPFCKRKCLYCDFVSFVKDDDIKEKYVNALIEEIKNTDISYGDIKDCNIKNVCLSENMDTNYIAKRGDNVSQNIDTVFIGGGTPSLISPPDIERILEPLKMGFNKDIEITMEINPKTTDYNNLKAYRELGINRLSIGLQSVNDDELKLLGRIHDYKDFLKTYNDARNAGFENINIDLIFGLPGQEFKKYKHTLDEVTKLEPEHISAYSLIVEENTPFYEKYGQDKEFENELISDDEDRKMYSYTKEILLKNGYERYEISNFSKKGYECRHNLKYWDFDEYYGFGLNAASMNNDQRYKNTSDLDYYINNSKDPAKIRNIEEELDEETKVSEYIMVGLRKEKGIDLNVMKDRFGKDIFDIYGDKVKDYIDKGFMKCFEDRLSFTDKGFDICNSILIEFI